MKKQFHFHPMNYLIFPIFEDSSNSEVICKFKLRLDRAIAVYNAEIKYNKEICSTLPEDAPRHKEFETIQLIKNELTENLALKRDIEFNTPEYIDVFVSKLIFDKKFESVFCAKCNKELLKDDVIVRRWSRGEGLFAHGGRKLSCKNDHDLFNMMGWIS